MSVASWERLPTPTQFAVLAVALPGLIAHEYAHAVAALWEGADIEGFDWANGAVVIANPEQTTWRTYLAPMVAGVIGTGGFVTLAAWANLSLPVFAWVYLGTQVGAFLFPSVADIRDAAERIDLDINQEHDDPDRAQFLQDFNWSMIALAASFMVPWGLFLPQKHADGVRVGLVITFYIIFLLAFFRYEMVRTDR